MTFDTLPAPLAGALAERGGAQPLGFDDLGGVLPPRPVLLPAEDETATDGHREQGGEDDRGFRQVHNPSP